MQSGGPASRSMFLMRSGREMTSKIPCSLLISFARPGWRALYTAAHLSQAVALNVRSFVPLARADVAASAVLRCARARAQLYAGGAIALAHAPRPDRRDPADRVPARWSLVARSAHRLTLTAPGASIL